MWQIAQINIALLKYPLDSPEMKEFVDNLDAINSLAESSPGFVWRLKDEENNATAIRIFGDDMLVNMSVWENLESLKAYVYKSQHASIMSRKKEWFSKLTQSHIALWWIKAGHLPTPTEGKEKLEYLWLHGPSPKVFSFKKPFNQPMD